jgi:hypothetical protein
VWDLWTTKDGIESWRGPDGAGGQLHYAMTAMGEGQVAFMKKAGMPLTAKTRVTYTEVTRHAKLAYVNHGEKEVQRGFARQGPTRS